MEAISLNTYQALGGFFECPLPSLRDPGARDAEALSGLGEPEDQLSQCDQNPPQLPR